MFIMRKRNLYLLPLLIITLWLRVSSTQAQPSATITVPSTNFVTVALGNNVSLTAQRNNPSNWPGGNGSWIYSWNASGPSGVSFTPATTVDNNHTVTTTATFSTEGIYTISSTIQEQGIGGRTATSTTIIIYVVAMPPQADAPLSCNASSCSVASTNCPPEIFFASFQNGNYYSGNIANHQGRGALWRFTNVANINGQQINATVKIDEIFQAEVITLDEDNALDENGNSTIAGFFAPAIRPDQSLTTADRRGYVQFTIQFWMHTDNPVSDNDFQNPASLEGLNYVQFDMDGLSNDNPDGYTLRETGLIQKITGTYLSVNANTELTKYNYTSESKNWTGFAGSLCGRTNISNCAEVMASFKYTTMQSEITVRMGYDYHKTGLSSIGTYNNQPTFQHASKFGCYTFPIQNILPVTYKSFSAKRNGRNVYLLWQTATETSNKGFEIQRKIDSEAWKKMAFISSKADSGNSSSVLSYQFEDTEPSKSAIQYRLRQINTDGHSSYSEIRYVKPEEDFEEGLIYPNPCIDGKMNILLRHHNKINIKILDVSGHLVKQYKNINSPLFTIEEMENGFYFVQITNELTGATITKKVIVRR